MKAQIIAVTFGLAFLAAIGFGVWYALEATFHAFASLDRDVGLLAGIACIAMLAAAWVISRGLGASTRQARAMALREEKTSTYQLFVDFWESLVRRGRTQADQLPVDLAGKLQVLERHLALYGSATVIGAHTTLRQLERQKGAQHPALRTRFGEAIVAIRRDLGTDTPFNAAFQLERLVTPSADATTAVTGPPRDVKSPVAVAVH